MLQAQEKEGQSDGGVRTPRDGICTPPPVVFALVEVKLGFPRTQTRFKRVSTFLKALKAVSGRPAIFRKTLTCSA